MFFPRAILLSCLASIAPLVCSVQGASSRPPEHLKLRLVSPVESIQEGRSFRVGIDFELEDHWHIYWLNPGDSGQPPSVQWDLPDGYTAGPMEWPKPERLPVGPLMNYGYEKRVLFPVDIHAEARAGAHASVAPIAGSGVLKTLTLRARVKWLVCKDICLPGKAEVALELPITRSKGQESLEKPLFDVAERAIPAPLPASWKADAQEVSDGIVLHIVTGKARSSEGGLRELVFFPSEQNILDAVVSQSVEQKEGEISVRLRKSNLLVTLPLELKGVLEWNARAYDLHVPLKIMARASSPAVAAPPASVSAWSAVFLAFLGGIILNLMPCVFPVLSIKAFGLLEHSRETKRARILHGAFYGGGVLVSFWALAGTLLVLRGAGMHLGWGFQLQSPGFVCALAALLLLMALNLFGVFEVTLAAFPGTSFLLHSSSGRSGDLSAFFSGVLAVIVATPCTAPFMGTALGYALAEPGVIAMAVFTSLGLGLALPYLCLCLFPGWGRALPKPGRWMESLKQFLAFPLLATVVWLMSVLSVQVDTAASAALWVCLLGVALSAWVFGRFRSRRGLAFAALILAGAAAWANHEVRAFRQVQGQSRETSWQPFSQKRVDELLREGKPVFLDFTAAWCVSCKVNELIALSSPQFLERAKALGITLIRADWTQSDPEITHALESFGRNGVPLYVFYTGKRSDPPSILPQILTPKTVSDEFSRVSPGGNPH